MDVLSPNGQKTKSACYITQKMLLTLEKISLNTMNLLHFIEATKTILALIVGIASIAVLIRDWQYGDRRTKKYHQLTKWIIIAWGISSILSAILILIEPHLKTNLIKHEKSKLRPEVKINIQETADEILITLESSKAYSGIIDDLFFKFDIPVIFKAVNINNRQKVGNVDIYPTFLVSVGNDTIAQTVQIICKTIFPNGFFRARIAYAPTKVRPVPGSERRGYDFKYMPLMDLHDYSRILYTWKYKDEQIAETKYFDLSFLDYIKRDNANLLKVMRNEEFWKRINPPDLNKILDSVRTKWSTDWLSEFEKRRRDWQI